MDSEEILLMRGASYLLPDPGGEVVRDLLNELDSLLAALAAAERDAARYRWIRYWNRVDPLRLPEDVSFEHEDYFDAAIDAAMAREEG